MKSSLLNALGTLACVVSLARSLPAHAATLSEQVERYRLFHETEIVSQIDALTRLKSVAADPAGIAAAAHALETLLEQRGFAVQEFTAAPGTPPLVFGQLTVPKAKRTVAFYAHYDGQPVSPSQWNSDPFVPVMRAASEASGTHDIDWRGAKPPFDPEWRLYGRAVSDDKATITAFLTAIDALRAIKRRPAVNVKVLWEGEEEAGSPHLEQLLRAHRELLSADLFLIGDGPVHQTRRPMLTFGARGVLGLEATLYGPTRALHDGHYGNWAPNPAAMAAQLITRLRDADGNILIPGFGDATRALKPAERDAITALPPVDADLAQEFGLGRSEGHESLPLSLMRPALNIRGLRAGQVGAAATNAIPTNAQISIDFRLVPDQTPALVRASVERFLQDDGWTLTADEPDLAIRSSHPRLIRLQWDQGYPALRSDMTSPAAKAVIAAAVSASRVPIVLLPMSGASVPLYLFADVFGAPVICLPIVNHDNNQHAANENLRLQNLWDGIDTYAAMLARLGW